MGEAEEDFLAKGVGGVVGAAGAVDQFLDAALQVVLVQAGGALFQVLREFYGTDRIAFTFVSDELNGTTLANDGTSQSCNALLPRRACGTPI